MNDHILGRLRTAHRAIIQEVLGHLLPLHGWAADRAFHGWVLQVRELCLLLEIGTDYYLYEKRVSAESRALSRLMQSMVHSRYREVLGMLQANRDIMDNDLAKRVSATLLPVIQAYDLAASRDFLTLQMTAMGQLQR